MTLKLVYGLNSDDEDGADYLTVDGSYLRFFVTRGIFDRTQTERTFNLRSVRSVAIGWHKPWFGRECGTIQFKFGGGGISREEFEEFGSSIPLHSKADHLVALEIKKSIESTLAFKPSRPNAPKHFVADEILKLKKLMDEGILTKNEFEAKKKQLLAL